MSRQKGFVKTILVNLFAISMILTLGGANSAAEKFPSREIIIVVYQAAGGSLDLVSRILAEYLKKELGVPIVVENRPEGGGIKGIMDVYRAKPDGYLLMPNIMPRNAQLETVYKAPFKIMDFTYLDAFQTQEGVVIVSKNSPCNNLQELIETSKRKSLNCSISGIGTISHLDAMLLKKKVGVNLEVVPFKGAAPAMMALLGGNVDLATMDAFSALLQKDKIRALAIFAERSSKKFSGVPTIKELGYDVPFGYTVTGICGPSEMPEDIRRILSDALVKVFKNPDFISKLEQMGPTHVYMSGPEFRRLSESFYKLVEEYKDVFMEK